MDLAGGVVSDCALLNGPGADLIGTDGEETNQAKRFESGVDEFARGGFGNAQISHKLLLTFGVQLRQLIFELRADADYGR